MIIDDHDMFAKGLERLINQTTWATVCGIATNIADGLHLIKKFCPEILLLDLFLGPEMSLKAIPEFKKLHPEMKIVILTISDKSEDILATTKYDISGYIIKSTAFEKFELYLNDIIQGNIRVSESLASLLFSEFLANSKSGMLTPREINVAELLRQGLSNKEIAEKLCLSIYTVKCHVSSIIKKQKLSNRHQIYRKSN